MGSPDFTVYIPGIGTISYSGENSAVAHFAAAIANHCNLVLLFYQVPITVGWTEVAWYERFARHLYIWPVA